MKDIVELEVYKKQRIFPIGYGHFVNNLINSISLILRLIDDFPMTGSLKPNYQKAL